MKTVFPCIRNPIIKVRQSWDCLMFIMGILIWVRQHTYTEMAPMLQGVNLNLSLNSLRYSKSLNNIHQLRNSLDSKIHGANMGPSWVLSAPDEPHVGPMNLATGEVTKIQSHLVLPPAEEHAQFVINQPTTWYSSTPSGIKIYVFSYCNKIWEDYI